MIEAAFTSLRGDLTFAEVDGWNPSVLLRKRKVCMQASVQTMPVHFETCENKTNRPPVHTNGTNLLADVKKVDFENGTLLTR